MRDLLFILIKISAFFQSYLRMQSSMWDPSELRTEENPTTVLSTWGQNLAYISIFDVIDWVIACKRLAMLHIRSSLVFNENEGWHYFSSCTNISAMSCYCHTVTCKTLNIFGIKIILQLPVASWLWLYTKHFKYSL